MYCPDGGSSAQLKVVSSEYREDGWDIEVVRHYVCGWGEKFNGLSYYKCEGYEIFESEKKKKKGLTKAPAHAIISTSKGQSPQRKEMILWILKRLLLRLLVN